MISAVEKERWIETETLQSCGFFYIKVTHFRNIYASQFVYPINLLIRRQHIWEILAS